MSGRHEVEEQFSQANVRRKELGELSKSLQEQISFMEYKIRKSFKSFSLISICGGDRNNFIVDPNFQRAFTSLSQSEQVDYYAKTIDLGLKVCEENKDNDLSNLDLEEEGASKTMEIEMLEGSNWKPAQIEIKGFKVNLKTKEKIVLNLKNYILRRSKKKGKKCYVLEAVKDESRKTIRFCFPVDESDNLLFLKDKIDLAQKMLIKKQISGLVKNKKGTKTGEMKHLKLRSLGNEENFDKIRNKMDMNKKSNDSSDDEQEDLAVSRQKLNVSICEEMVKGKDDQNLQQELSEIISKQNEAMDKIKAIAMQQRKKNKKEDFKINTCNTNTSERNVFRILLPDYDLRNISSTRGFESIYSDEYPSHTQIYYNQNHSIFKMEIDFRLPPDVVCKALHNMHLYKFWHPEVSEAHTKLKISSENSSLTYQELKPFSEWYRHRDYLLLLHLFKVDDTLYLVGKSVQNTNFIPFPTIIRGKIEYIVWRIKEKQKGSSVMMEFNINHGGLVSKSHHIELTERYLKGFKNLEQYFEKSENQKKLTEELSLNWMNYDESDENQRDPKIKKINSLKSCDFESGSEISEDEEIFYSIDMDEDEFGVYNSRGNKDGRREDTHLSSKKNKKEESMIMEKEILSEHELNEEDLKQSSTVNNKIFEGKQDIKTNENGLIILPQQYLKRKYPMTPFDKQRKPIKIVYDNIIEKNDWELKKDGGLKLINKQKIETQNSVLSYVMKTLKKNLFSGKGILNISLPVTIFADDSNLQRMCQAMSLAPQFLEKAAREKDAIEKFKLALCFGLSNSIIYFDIEKVFNPILGETYQGYIRGCPVYAEQISHHPPITTMLFIGRNYKVTANIEAKVNIHLNSGDGINEGFYHIVFDEGHEIIFQTPPGQVSGLAMGDRGFNLQGKGYYLDRRNHLYCEMKFIDDGGFFSKKKRKFIDEITGNIVKVRESFVNKFQSAPLDKKPSPDKADILETYSQLSGRWPFNLSFDDRSYYDIRGLLPDLMEDQIYPLPSNSNYREDIYYRKLNDLVRSQTEKERLEVIQRGDRKLREKYHGKKSH